MIKQVSEELFALLTAETAFTDVMGQKLFPIIALEGNDFPLATYRITDQVGKTKDADGASIQLNFVFSHQAYDDCVVFTDAMKPILEANYDWISSTVDYEPEGNYYFGIINLEKY